MQVRNLVGAQIPAHEPAVLCVQHLLEGKPADALDDSALGLSPIDQEVEARTQVVDRPHSVDFVGPPQAVHGDLAQGRPVHVIGEGLPFLTPAVKPDPRSGIVSLGGQTHPACIGRPHEGPPRQVGRLALPRDPPLRNLDVRWSAVAGTRLTGGAGLELRGGNLAQALQDGPAGQLGGLAVEIRSRGGSGGGGVGHPERARALHPDQGRLDRKHTGGHGVDLGFDPLAHFHAPRGHDHAPVGVHVHESTTLVQGRVGERDAEADRHQGQALLLQAMGAVELLHPAAAPLQGVPVDRLLPAAAGPAAPGGHSVRKAVPLAQQVLLLYHRRGNPEGPGRPGDGALDHEHGLGSPEAAESGVGGQVRAGADPGGLEVGHEVAARGVKQAALQDRGRQVGGGPGVLEEGHLVGQDLAGRLHPQAKIRNVGMALARAAHVLLATQHQLDRSFQVHGPQGRQSRPWGGLVLLSPESAAQALDLHVDSVHAQAEHPGDGPLHPRGALGCGNHTDRSVFSRYGQGRLSLQVEVLLGPAFDGPLDDAVAAPPGSLDVAEDKASGRHDQQALLVGLSGIEHRRQRLDLQAHPVDSPSGGAGAVGHDQGHRLACEVNLRFGQKGLVGLNRSDLVFPRNIPGGEHGANTGTPGGLPGVEATDPAVSHRGDEHRSVQCTLGLGQIVNETGFPAKVQGRLEVLHRQSSPASS